MSSQQNMINRTDLVKPPQYAIEGTATTDYGKSLASPEFFCPVQKGKLSKDNQPQFIDKTFAGSIDRQGVIKVREQNRMTLSGWLIKDNLDIIEWAISEPNGSDTPEESRTWLYSYKNAGGNEVYCVAKGCKPLSCTITISKDQPAMV